MKGEHIVSLSEQMETGATRIFRPPLGCVTFRRNRHFCLAVANASKTLSVTVYSSERIMLAVSGGSSPSFTQQTWSGTTARTPLMVLSKTAYLKFNVCSARNPDMKRVFFVFLCRTGGTLGATGSCPLEDTQSHCRTHSLTLCLSTRNPVPELNFMLWR